MRLPINWSNNFLSLKDTIDLLSFIKNLQFSPNDIMEDWVKNPYAEIGKTRNTIALLVDLDVLTLDAGGKIHWNDKQLIKKGPRGLKIYFENVFLEKNKVVLLNLVPYDKLYYSEQTSLYGFYRNNSPLKFTGGLNLLISFGVISQINDYYVEIKNKKYEGLIIDKVKGALNGLGAITPEALKRLIDAKNIIGEKSEVEALRYELKRLTDLGIKKKPLRVSLLDVAKGYDMLSYESSNSTTYDRFIEIKSFNNHQFYISKNEMTKAKELDDKYYLYLVKANTENGITVEEVRNPVRQFKDWGKWGLEPTEYVVRRFE